MPSCVNCGPAVTPIAISVLPPLVGSGTGTPQDPLTIGMEAGSSAIALAVRDSETVNMTLFGTGTEDDPYVISADTGSAFKLTDLSDVDADPPTAGQVPTWVGPSIGGHWEFQTPAFAEDDQIAASAITGQLSNQNLPTGVPVDGGVIDTQDWNRLLTPGTYRVSNSTLWHAPPAGSTYPYGTLLIFASGSSVTQMFLEHGTVATGTPASSFLRGQMWMRTKWNASDWTAWEQLGRVDTNLALTGSDALGAANNVPIVSAFLVRSGNTVTFSCSVTLPNGLTNAANLNGDIAALQIGTIPPAHVPAGGAFGHIATTGQGLALTGYVDQHGAVFISTMPSGTLAADAPITTGKNFPAQLGGTWVAKELVS